MLNSLNEKISKDCEKKVVDLYQEGYSQKDIHRSLNISLKDVRNILLNYGFFTRNYRSLSNLSKDIIELLIYEGYSYHRISTILDISFHVVRELSESRNLDIAKKKRNKVDLKTLQQERFDLEQPVHSSCYASFTKEYEKGASFIALYEKFSLGMQDVCPLVNKINETEDLLSLHKKHLEKKILSMLEADFPIHMIAKKLNISLSIVKKTKQCLFKV